MRWFVESFLSRVVRAFDFLAGVPPDWDTTLTAIEAEREVTEPAVEPDELWRSVEDFVRGLDCVLAPYYGSEK